MNKLFGKKDKNKRSDEEIRENESLDKEEAEQEEPIDIDSLMHDKDAEPIDIDSLMDDEEELTDEEIAAAEKFEEEHKEEYENVTPLDYDGDFIDFEGMMGDDSEIEDEETPDEPEIVGVPGQFTMEKTVFASDEPIMTTASAGTHAWLEFYYESEGSYTAFDWCYVGDGGSAVDEPFDLRNVVYSAGAAYSFTAGKYKIAWFPTDDRANEVVIEFEIQ